MTDEQGVVGKRRRTPAEIEQIVSGFESSGLNRSQFCRREGLTLGVLNRYLQRRHAASGSAGSGDGLVAVELAGKKQWAESSGSCGLAVVLSKGRRIAVSAGFDAATLERVVQVLERMQMFGFGPATRIYVAVGATDMRKNYEGLYGLVRDRLQCAPLSGHVFLFCNAQRNRLKLLVWDGSGLWICAKKLSKGRFRWPEPRAGEIKVVLSHEELAMLLGGIDLSQARPRPWYRSQIASDEVGADRINTA